MTSLRVPMIQMAKRSRIGMGPIKLGLPPALMLVGVFGFIASFILAAILKWFGLAIVGVGLFLQFWPKEQSQDEHLSEA